MTDRMVDFIYGSLTGIACGLVVVAGLMVVMSHVIYWG